MGSVINHEEEELNRPLMPPETNGVHPSEAKDQTFSRKLWVESKKLWQIVGPAIFSRVAAYTMNIVSQAFAGHIGAVELAAFSIANTVIVGFNFGLLLGMASALETLCGQAFGAKRYHMLGIYMQRSWIVLFLCCFILLPVYVFAAPLMRLLGQPEEVAKLSGVVACWMIPLHFSFAFQFPLQRSSSIIYVAIGTLGSTHFIQVTMRLEMKSDGSFGWPTCLWVRMGSWVCVIILGFLKRCRTRVLITGPNL